MDKDNATYISLPTDIQQVITTDQAWHYGIVPKAAEKNRIVFYVSPGRQEDAIRNELEMLLGKEIVLEQADDAVIKRTLGKYYRRNNHSGKQEVARLNVKKADDFLFKLISEARQLGSSDIHLEIYEDKCRVRVRIDGQLIERYLLKQEEYPGLVNKIKIRANLDIAEKRLPQDGRIFFHEGGMKFDIRVSVLPTLHGEKVVLRLLGNDAAEIDINELGFNQQELERYLEGIRKPNGILLISGPTGSGKTTTLYATLKILNKEKTNILTIEDPIEYTLEGINQVQLKESIGLTFASALKTFLRQDPDIIMLGEIRDGETAQMAVRAALTGHLVLSTIHTNSAWGTISRLVDMGVPPYLLAGTINTSVAQRLLRLLCPHCKQEQDFDESAYPGGFRAPKKVDKHFVAVGCEQCYYTGYKGRKAIYEVISIDHKLAEEIKEQRYSVEALLRKQHVSSLTENAFELFEKGETSLDEVYPVLLTNY